MTAGAPGHGKDEVAAELAVLLARLFTRGGNQVGAVLYDNGAVRTLPPGNGRRHVLHLAALLSRTAGMSTVTATGDHPRRGRLRINGHLRNTASHHRGTTNLAAMLDAVARLARRRALIIVISDFIGDGDWERSLLRLGPRHEVVALRVVDAAGRRIAAGAPTTSSSSRTPRPASSCSSTPAILGCAPGSAPPSRTGTPGSPRECAGPGCPCTASARTRTWPPRSSRSCCEHPGAGAHDVRSSGPARRRPAGRRGLLAWGRGRWSRDGGPRRLASARVAAMRAPAVRKPPGSG